MASMRYLFLTIVGLAVLYSCTKDIGKLPTEPEPVVTNNPADTACVTNISYSLHISPVTSVKCAIPACHAPSANYPDLSTYSSFKAYLDASIGPGSTLKS